MPKWGRASPGRRINDTDWIFYKGNIVYFPKPNGMSFFYPRKMGNVTVLISHSDPILHGKQDEWSQRFPGEGEKQERKSSTFPLPASPISHGHLHQHPIVEPPITLDHSGCLLGVYLLSWPQGSLCHTGRLNQNAAWSVPLFPGNTDYEI